MHSSIFLVAFAAALASAKTDLQGCTSSDVIAYGGASVLYYVPGTGEICSFLDCGGGAGAPLTNVPGCAGYKGTATITPSYISGYGPSASSTSSSSYISATTTSSSASTISGASITSAAQTSKPTTLSVVATSVVPGAALPSGGSSSNSSSITGSVRNGTLASTTKTPSATASGSGSGASSSSSGAANPLALSQGGGFLAVAFAGLAYLL